MPLSFKSRLAKLEHKGQISQEEYQELLAKLDGHDKQIREDAIEDCKQILLDAMARDGKTKCHEYMVAFNKMEQLKQKGAENE